MKYAVIYAFKIILNYNPGDRTSTNESADIERYFNGQPLENSVMEAQIQPNNHSIFEISWQEYS